MPDHPSLHRPHPAPSRCVIEDHHWRDQETILNVCIGLACVLCFIAGYILGIQFPNALPSLIQWVMP